MKRREIKNLKERNSLKRKGKTKVSVNSLDIPWDVERRKDEQVDLRKWRPSFIPLLTFSNLRDSVMNLPEMSKSDDLMDSKTQFFNITPLYLEPKLISQC